VSPSAADLWRFTHWGVTTPEGERAETADADSDGIINLLEYALGSSPRRADSMPQVTASRTPDGRLAITFLRQALPEITYAVEYSPDMETDSWQSLWTSSAAQNVDGSVTVDGPVQEGSHAFLRVRVTGAPPP
jgi:hypothetical protein